MDSMNSPRIARAACLASLGLALLVPGVARAEDMYAETLTNAEMPGGMEALADQGVTYDSDDAVATDSDAAEMTDNESSDVPIAEDDPTHAFEEDEASDDLTSSDAP